MKKILNLLALILVIAGLCLKMNGIEGANIVILISAVTMLLSHGLFTINDNKEAGLSNWLNYLLVGILTLFIVGALFKILHWPFSTMLLVAGFGLLPISILALIFQKEESKISKQFFITFFTFFILLIGTLPGKPFCADHCKTGDAKTEACCDKGAAKMDACKANGAKKDKCCDKGAAKMDHCKKDGGEKGACPKGECTPGQCAQKGECPKQGACPKQGECKKGEAEKGSCCKKGEGEKDRVMTKDHCAK